MDYLITAKPTLHRKLLKCGLNSCLSILTLNITELQELLDINHKEAEELQETIGSLKAPRVQLGNETCDRLSTGCEQIDNILRGGLPIGRILEIYGCSGVGKTQFSLQLLVMVQLPRSLGGFKKSAVYISTEQPFPSKRFHQLCQEVPKRFSPDLVESIDFENNVYIETCHDTEQLLISLNQRLPTLMEKVEIGLIVVDSIAGIFRSEHQSTNYFDRSIEFSRITTQLRRLLKQHNAVGICVNQVTDNIKTGNTEPSLGLSWYNLVAQRFALSRVNPLSTTRQFAVIKSYELKESSAQFTIQSDGLQ